MKKQEKLDVIRGAIAIPEICRCYFIYDENYYYYYPNAVNDTFLLGQEEDDFILDGYCIRKISHLRKVEIKDDLCNAISKDIGNHNAIKMPEVDITCWNSIFTSLKAMNRYIIVENERTGAFAIGLIEKVLCNKIYFKPFDANGVWDEVGYVIPYSEITSVSWNTRYTENWQRYMEKLGQ